MYNIIKKGIKKGSDNMAKATDMAIPLYPKALENADYVVLTTLLDKKWSTYDTKNKPNFRKMNRCDYLANKEEMIKATGDLDSIPILGEKPKKPLSKSQWDKSFKKLRELGIVEELTLVLMFQLEYEMEMVSSDGVIFMLVNTSENIKFIKCLNNPTVITSELSGPKDSNQLLAFSDALS